MHEQSHNALAIAVGVAIAGTVLVAEGIALEALGWIARRVYR